MHQRDQRAWIARRTIRNPHAELDQHWIFNQPLLDQLVHQNKLTGIEHLQFRADAELPHAYGHGAQYPGGIDHHVFIPRSEAHRPAIQCADLGTQLLHVHQPLQRAPTKSVEGFIGKGEFTPPSTSSPPILAVRLITGFRCELRMRDTTCRYSAGSREPCRVARSRTWMCTTAAPALAASIAESAICSGVTGTCGLRSTPLPPPVTAHVMNTSEIISASPLARGSRAKPSPEMVNVTCRSTPVLERK
ncbi:hypothetical protein ABIC08_009249 [Bradyrhizobium sp. RT9b]